MKISLRKLFRPNVPFPVKESPIYYGWLIVIAGTISMTGILPASPPGMAPFTDEMIRDLNVSRDSFSAAYMIGTMLAGLAVPLTGWLFDRYNIRMLVVVSMIALGFNLMLLGYGDRLLLMLPGIDEVSESAQLILLCLCFFGLRYIGIGMIVTGTRTMIFRWFRRNRGRAAGINGIMLSLSFSSAPVIFNFFINGYGWRDAWVVMGGIYALGIATIAWLFLRESPQSVGVKLEPEGDNPETKGRNRDPNWGYTLREAMSFRAFWIIIFVLGIHSLFSTGIAFNIVALAAERNVARDTAIFLFLPGAVSNIITSLVLGAKVEKMRLNGLIALLLGVLIVSTASLFILDTLTGKAIYAIASGIGWGTFGILYNISWPRYFGQKSLGAINGVSSGMTIILSALGPFLYGVVYTARGTFDPILFCGMIASMLLLPLAFLMRAPDSEKEDHKDSRKALD